MINLRCVAVCCWYGWQPGAVAPRYAVIAAMIIGIVIVIAQGDVVTNDVVFKPVLPTYITPDFRLLTV